jgi:F-type H+-transporting ATPase subunit delta
MKIGKQARREAKSLFRICLVKGLLDEGRVRKAVDQVAQKKPRGYLRILSHFVHLVRLEIERRTANVESAVPLAPHAQGDVRNRLTQVYGAGLTMNFGVNPELIGGLRVKVGSDVYDGSIEARLKALQESF